jgi:hypothetical protein
LDTLLLNLAYISYVTASLMPSGLKLRLGLIAQSIAFITWGVVSGTPTTVAWNLVFVSINIYKAVRIFLRDAVTLTADEESVRAAIFDGIGHHPPASRDRVDPGRFTGLRSGIVTRRRRLKQCPTNFDVGPSGYTLPGGHETERGRLQT